MAQLTCQRVRQGKTRSRAARHTLLVRREAITRLAAWVTYLKRPSTSSNAPFPIRSIHLSPRPHRSVPVYRHGGSGVQISADRQCSSQHEAKKATVRGVRYIGREYRHPRLYCKPASLRPQCGTLPPSARPLLLLSPLPTIGERQTHR